MGIKHGDEPTKWVHHDDIQDYLFGIDWDETNVIAHNTRFEAAILAWHYHIDPAFWSDTMSMAKSMCHYKSASLKAVAERTFPDDPTMRKGDELVLAEGMDFLDEKTEKAIAGYCIQDVDLCKAIYDQYFPYYPTEELALIDLTIRMFSQPRLALNTTILDEVIREEKEKKANVLKELGLTSTQLASNKQFAELLEDCQIKVPMKTSPRTGKKTFAFSKTDLGFQKLLKDPVAGPLAQGRLIIKSTQNETRAERFKAIASVRYGQLPVPLNYYGAHTGRFSGSDKVNIQNLPRGGALRKALIAPDNGWLVSCDASQIEARMLAWLAGETKLIMQFKNKVDVYKQFASTIYNCSPEEITPTQRFVGKTAILGLGYGMGANKFRLMLEQGATGPVVNLTEAEALDVVTKYRTSFPSIGFLWKFCNDKISQMKRYDWAGEEWINPVIRFEPWRIRLPNGMALRYDPQEFDETTTFGGKITENIVQALARIVLTHHMLEINKAYPVAFTVHDEITCYVPSHENPEEILDYMLNVFKETPQWCKGLPLDAEGSYGHHYSK